MEGPREPSDRRQQLGRAAEDAAVALLQAQGVTILLRNYRCRMGELDIVAQAAPDLLLVVEVRARSRSDFGGGAGSVDAGKQRRIVRAATHLLMVRSDLRRLRARFDVIDVQAGPARELRCQWLQAAFSC
jgi:putative endonuclease